MDADIKGDMLSSWRSDILSVRYPFVMSQAPPAFITHHEIETFLGGGKGAKRQRQRLQEDHRLPEPHWLARVDRFRTGIYPTFALAGLIDAVVQAPRALDRMQRLSAKVFASVAFRELTVALHQSITEVLHAQGPDGWRFDTVVQRLGALAEPVVLEWDGLVGEAEDQLVQWGIRFSSEFGSVERRSADMYVIALAERKERFSANRVAAPMHKGSAVAVEHVMVMGTGMDFVMPAVATHTTVAESAQLDWSAVTESDWNDALIAAERRAQAFSFDADYWANDAQGTARPGLLAGAPSGRQAALELLASRQRS